MIGAMKAYSVKQFTDLAKSGGLAKPISEKPYTAREKGQPKTENGPRAQTSAQQPKNARRQKPEGQITEVGPYFFSKAGHHRRLSFVPMPSLTE
jgi:hypothetical protein